MTPRSLCTLFIISCGVHIFQSLMWHCSSSLLSIGSFSSGSFEGISNCTQMQTVLRCYFKLYSDAIRRDVGRKIHEILANAVCLWRGKADVGQNGSRYTATLSTAANPSWPPVPASVSLVEQRIGSQMECLAAPFYFNSINSSLPFSLFKNKHKKENTSCIFYGDFINQAWITQQMLCDIQGHLQPRTLRPYWAEAGPRGTVRGLLYPLNADLRPKIILN